MTIRAMNWAWGVELPPAMKLVLLKLADRANDDGQCWPGMDVVAEACGVSKASVIRYVAKMESMGLVKVERRKGDDGRQATNIYCLNMEWEPGCNLTPGDEPGCKSNEDRVAVVQPEIRLKPYLETKGETTDATTKVAAPESHQESILPAPITWDGIRWQVDETIYDQWLAAYGNGRTASDTEDWIEAELARASVWLQANPRKRKKNYLRFLTGWLTRAADRQRQRYPQQHRPYH